MPIAHLTSIANAVLCIAAAGVFGYFGCQRSLAFGPVVRSGLLAIAVGAAVAVVQLCVDPLFESARLTAASRLLMSAGLLLFALGYMTRRRAQHHPCRRASDWGAT